MGEKCLDSCFSIHNHKTIVQALTVFYQHKALEELLQDYLPTATPPLPQSFNILKEQLKPERAIYELHSTNSLTISMHTAHFNVLLCVTKSLSEFSVLIHCS